MHRSLSLLLSSVAAIRWLVYLSCHLWDGGGGGAPGRSRSTAEGHIE